MPRVILTLIDQAGGGDGGDDTSQLGYILWLVPNEMESNLCIRDSQYKLRIDVHTTALIITHSQHLSLAPHRHQSPRPKIIMIVSKGGEGTERCASTSGVGVCPHCESPSREDLRIYMLMTNNTATCTTASLETQDTRQF